jgi:hypothetical protein
MLGSLSEADDAVQGSLASPQPLRRWRHRELSAWLTTDSFRGRSRVAHAPISYSARVTSHVPGLKQCRVEINASPGALYLEQRGQLIAVGEISARSQAPTRSSTPRRSPTSDQSATSHHYSNQHDEHPYTSTTRRKRVNSPRNEQQSSGQTLL